MSVDIPRPSTENPYEAGIDSWDTSEIKRLKTMDGYLAAVTEKDLRPILGANKEGTLLDIGAGAGVTVQDLCAENDVIYRPLDINKALLDQRDSDPSLKIHASNDAIPLPDKSIDITYSRAVTAWAQDPQRAISEQLRVTKGEAVFTEFDWSQAQPGQHCSNEQAQALLAVKDGLESILTSFGFNTNYGSQLGTDINTVMQEQGIVGRHEMEPHIVPEGDHRDLLCGAAEGLFKLARDANGQLPEGLKSLEQKVETLKKLPYISFVIPALVTHRVVFARTV